MTLEYLEAGPEAGPRWRRVALALVLVVAIVAAGLFWWTGRVRAQATGVLETAMANASRDAAAGEAVVLSMLQYTSPAIWSTSVGEDVRAGMRELVQGSAAEVVRTLDESRQEAESTFVLPWDSTERQAKDAVLAFVTAQRSRFEQIAVDARALDDVLGQPGPTESAARALLRASRASTAGGR